MSFFFNKYVKHIVVPAFQSFVWDSQNYSQYSVSAILDTLQSSMIHHDVFVNEEEKNTPKKGRFTALWCTKSLLNCDDLLFFCVLCDIYTAVLLLQVFVGQD